MKSQARSGCRRGWHVVPYSTDGWYCVSSPRLLQLDLQYFFCFRHSPFFPLRLFRLRLAATGIDGRAMYHLVRKCDDCKSYRVREEKRHYQFQTCVLRSRVDAAEQ